MFRCVKCQNGTYPATAYLTGEPLCQEHLAEVIRELAARYEVGTVDIKLAMLQSQLTNELSKTA